MGERPSFVPENYKPPERDDRKIFLPDEPAQRPGKEIAWDTKWSDEFEKAGSFLILPSFEGDPVHRQEEKKKFLAGDAPNPEFDYPKIDVLALAKNEGDLLRLKREVKSREGTDAVRLAYQWAINEKIAEIRMLQATARGDMRRFDR